MASDKTDAALSLSTLAAACEQLVNLKATALPKVVQKRVEVLQQIQSEHDEVEAKFFEERRALEDKYQKLYAPLYSKRYDVVNGVVSNEPAEYIEKAVVPSFWLTAMKRNEVVADYIQEPDEEALKYLTDIKWSRIENDEEGFKLEFYFDPSNPFFKNSVLTKTFFMIDEVAVGTEIEWFSGKCLTEKIVITKKKPKKGSNNKEAKTIMKTEYLLSFFSFFNTPQGPEDEDLIQEEVDYEVGLTIKDKIIPHAVSWFTGEAA